MHNVYVLIMFHGSKTLGFITPLTLAFLQFLNNLDPEFNQTGP